MLTYHLYFRTLILFARYYVIFISVDIQSYDGTLGIVVGGIGCFLPAVVHDFKC